MDAGQWHRDAAAASVRGTGRIPQRIPVSKDEGRIQIEQFRGNHDLSSFFRWK